MPETPLPSNHEEWCNIYKNVGGCSCSMMPDTPLPSRDRVTNFIAVVGREGETVITPQGELWPLLVAYASGRLPDREAIDREAMAAEIASDRGFEFDDMDDAEREFTLAQASDYLDAALGEA